MGAERAEGERWEGLCYTSSTESLVWEKVKSSDLTSAPSVPGQAQGLS